MRFTAVAVVCLMVAHGISWSDPGVRVKPEELMGKWSGKWNGRWAVHFTITRDPHTKELMALYECQRRVGGPLTQRRVPACFEGNVLRVDNAEIRFFPGVTDRAEAVGNFGGRPTASLRRQVLPELPPWQDVGQQAGELIRGGKAAEALALLDRAAARDPGLKPVFAMRFFAERDRKNYTGALREINVALDGLDEPSIAAMLYHERGDLYRQLKDFGRATEDFTRELELAKSVSAYVSRGHCHFDRRDFGRAEADYAAAVELNDKAADAWWFRGRARFEKGEYDKALADFDQSIRLNPGDPDGHWQRAMTARQLRRWDRAIADFTEFVRLSPPSEQAQGYHARALCWEQKGELTKALADCERAIEIDTAKSEPAYRVSRSRLLRAMGRFDTLPDGLHDTLLRATAWVINEQASGTATLIDKNARLLVTNHHCVKHYDRVRIVFPAIQGNKYVFVREWYWKHQEELAINAWVLYTDPGRDLALVQVDRLPEGVKPLETALQTSQIRGAVKGDRVFSMCSPAPKGLAWQVAVGEVRDTPLRAYGLAKSDYRIVVGNIISDMPIRPGYSGSAVVNEHGEIVGTTHAGSTDRAFAIDMQHLNLFLEEAEGKEIFSPSGALTAANAQDRVRAGCYAQVHVIPLKQGEVYTITMSGDFDPHLRLEDLSGSELRSDENAGGPGTAKIFFRALRDGTYRVIATSARPRQTGAYRVTVFQAGDVGKTFIPSPTKRNVPEGTGPIVMQVKDGLTEKDVVRTDPRNSPTWQALGGASGPEVVRESFERAFKVKLTTDNLYVIDLRSGQFDAWLTIRDSKGRVLDHDDESGGGGNARILFRPPWDDTFRLTVTSSGGKELGDFALTVRHLSLASK